MLAILKLAWFVLLLASTEALTPVTTGLSITTFTSFQTKTLPAVVRTQTQTTTRTTLIPPPPPPPLPPLRYPFPIDVGNLDNKCQNSTFIDETSNGSPLASDCMVIVSNIRAGGTWRVEDVLGYEHQLVQYGTCAYAVRPGEEQWGHLGAYYKLGNEDIMHTIVDAANMFASADTGRLGASGRMHCENGADQWLKTINWRIFRNGDPVRKHG
ncbi:hypothetical protein DL546_002720 [Coniochaeta pulveracea]|uniref:Ecp2 effector protein-like domain-containing protein n=1 Tax=Coniochaeta pulveracea TaxID=177199 RepID=A0A420YKR1_9PEZI|nr:hypothetical protein DL546_002720 [Coniochaeta pulveracea]